MKNIIITGTSRGIGFELALNLANKGHQILAISRKTKKELIEHPNITCLLIDISIEEELKKVQTFLNSEWKKVDIIIHNAGQLVNKPFEQLTLTDFKNVYNVNVFAVAELSKFCIPFMDKGSHIVSISSMGGIQGSMKFPGLAAYSSSKGAVITLMELLAEEYKENGISFNTLALGAVQTEMLEEAFPGYQAPTTPKEMADYIANFSLNGNKYFNGKTLEVSSTTP